MKKSFTKIADLTWSVGVCNGDIFTRKFILEFQRLFPDLEVKFVDQIKAKNSNFYEFKNVVIKFSNEADEAQFIMKVPTVEFNLSFEDMLSDFAGGIDDKLMKEHLDTICKAVIDAI